jgi:hypothetical protein
VCILRYTSLVARLIPSDIGRLELAGGHRPELETLRYLADALPAAYTVFHGVHWSREYRGHTVYGEIDFAVVNRAGWVLLIEQKNGPLLETDAGLAKAYPGGTVKPVGDQVRRSLEGVREKFKAVHAGHANLHLDYLVYCPDHRMVRLNAATLDASRVVDASERGRLAERIAEQLGPGTAAADGWVEKVEDFFAQTFEVRVDIHAQVSAHERQFTRLGSGLARTLAGFEMDPLRLRVRATAGSGKTFVAHAFFEKAVAKGRRPLLVCFNRPLAERLKALVGQAGRVSTFYGLCDAFLADRGRKLDFDQMKTDCEFWRRVADMVTAETVPDTWRFDCLIVDEGQDFEQEWFEILRLFLRDDADVLWLEDPDQNLLGKPSVRLDGFVRFGTRVNHRTPASVARFIQRTLPVAFECGSDLPGLGVTVTPYERSEDQPRLLGKIVDGLLEQGFRYGNIAVVTMRSGQRSVFSGRDRAGRHDLRRFTGEYDLFGNQVSTPGRLLFDSVNRFKGQQAAAVVLVDIDPDHTALEAEQRRLFCGMTRATVKLDLLVRAGNPFNARFVEARADSTQTVYDPGH